ncbi:MAG: SpoIID/LytB domain-containing protein [Ignavibacteriae bacterium]|nr:SpoIID/LytB domain-containing protein [Ignavibacteriota bacterium]
MEKEPNVSVAILSDISVEFVLYGEFHSNFSSDLFNGKFTAEIKNGFISLLSNDGEIKNLQEIIFTPTDENSDTFLLKNVTIGINFHWEQKQNQQFAGKLKILLNDDKLTIINIIPVEQYLQSVISSEMSPTSSLELLKAHAIISRSWLLAQMDKSSSLIKKEKFFTSETITDDEIIKWYDREDHILFDVCADDHCQRYQGITKNYAHNAELAVKSTNGLILQYENKICDARFSKSCGGKTESFENVWENVPHEYLKTLVDYKFEHDGYDLNLANENSAVKWISNSPVAFCNTNDSKILEQVLNNYDQTTTDFYRWSVNYTQEEIANIIKTKSAIDFGDIIDLIPILRGNSGRIIKLKIIGTLKTLIVGKELEIRKFLSMSHLYSSAFVVEKGELQNNIPTSFKLIGAGWGHGVGLCQIGAAVMGEKGYRFDEILLHYFRGAQIKKIY